jgi:hypothetical protein
MPYIEHTKGGRGRGGDQKREGVIPSRKKVKFFFSRKHLKQRSSFLTKRRGRNNFNIYSCPNTSTNLSNKKKR